MNFLDVHNLSIGFEKDLIQNLNFSMKPGDRLIIYGSNGTGKSTLLQTLLNGKNRRSGSIKWNLPLNEILLIGQNTGFHDQTPDDVETFLSHVLLYQSPFRSLSAEDKKKIQEVRSKLGLENSPLRYLSGGQRQKLKIAQSLLLQTKVLLLDEPFNAIDQKSSQEIIQWLNRNRAEQVQILVLHDLEHIQKLQSPILWIQNSQCQVLSFKDWFTQIDKHFHDWLREIKELP